MFGTTRSGGTALACTGDGLGGVRGGTVCQLTP